jgi:hypothetical protein
MLHIDRDIELPQGRTRYPFSDMEQGDSILFTDERQAASARVAAVRFAKRYHSEWVFTLRKVENGWRLWRVQ